MVATVRGGHPPHLCTAWHPYAGLRQATTPLFTARFLLSTLSATMKGIISDTDIKEMRRSVRYVEIGFHEPVWVRTNSFWGGPSRSKVDKILLVLSDSPDHTLSRGMVLMTNTKKVYEGTNYWHGYGTHNNIFLYTILTQSKAFWPWIEIRSNRTPFQ